MIPAKVGQGRGHPPGFANKICERYAVLPPEKNYLRTHKPTKPADQPGFISNEFIFAPRTRRCLLHDCRAVPSKSTN